MRVFNKNLRLLLAILVMFAFSGCSPRGETLTLEQVLSNAKGEFTGSQLGLSEELSGKIAKLNTELESALNIAGKDPLGAQKLLKDIAMSLDGLTYRAGYTTRPAMSELTTQFFELSKRSDVTGDQVKLLIARTYFLLASELKTTKFSL